GSFVTRVPPARDVDRCDGAHQCFLRAVGNRLRQLSHIAIQIYLWMRALHPVINPSEASRFSCSLNSDRAVSHPTRSNRISSRGRSCPRLLKSAEITFAILAYPPVVCC